MEIIVGKTAGFCYGVNRAVEGCKKVLEENREKSICWLGEIVHNKTVVEDLKKDGIEFIDNISNAEDIIKSFKVLLLTLLPYTLLVKSKKSVKSFFFLSSVISLIAIAPRPFITERGNLIVPFSI